MLIFNPYHLRFTTIKELLMRPSFAYIELAHELLLERQPV